MTRQLSPTQFDTETAFNPMRFLRLVLFVLAVGFCLQSAPAIASPTPQQFVDDLANKAFAVLRDDTLEDAARFQKFRSLLREGVDLPRVGRFVLGKYWRRATPEQRSEYDSLFGDYVIASYASRLSEYAHSTVTVKGVVSNSGKEHIVTTLVRAPKAVEPIRVDWRVRDSGQGLKIVDIMIEGISMAISQRSEFASVIQSNGGDMTVLLDRLRGVAATIQPPEKVSASN